MVFWDNDDLCKNNYYYFLSTFLLVNPPPTYLPSTLALPTQVPAASFFATGALVANYNRSAPTAGVHVANGHPECSVASDTLALAASLPPTAIEGHIMPSFPHSLISLGPFANLDCKIVFTKTAVTVYHPNNQPILTGWREQDGPHLWRFPL